MVTLGRLTRSSRAHGLKKWKYKCPNDTAKYTNQRKQFTYTYSIRPMDALQRHKG